MSAIPRPSTLFSRIWSSYTTALRTRPLRTKMIQSGCLYVAADLVAQVGIEGRSIIGPAREKGADEEEERVWDPIRTARLTLYGSMVFAPLAHLWLGRLDRLRLSSKFLTLGARLSLDCLLWSPFVCAMFPTVLGLLEGREIRQVKQKLEMGWFPTWQKAVCVFGPAQLINFTLIPAPHRLMALQSVGLCWNIFLSWQNNKNNQLLAKASAHLEQVQLEALVRGGEADQGKEVREAVRQVQEAKERREKGRKEGSEDGVGVRMSWS